MKSDVSPKTLGKYKWRLFIFMLKLLSLEFVIPDGILIRKGRYIYDGD